MIKFLLVKFAVLATIIAIASNSKANEKNYEAVLNDFSLRLKMTNPPVDLSYLKAVHFSKRDELTQTRLKLLEKDISLTPKNTARWYALQNLKGSCVFHAGCDSMQEGLNVYEEIFREYTSSKNHDTLSINFVKSSIFEFCRIVGNRSAKANYTKDEVLSLLFLAWDAYTSTDKISAETTSFPNFSRAFESMELQQEVKAMVLKTIADPTVPRSYALLSAGGEVVAKDEPLKAIGFLREAKAFLPQQTRRVNGEVETSLDVNEAARLYDRLVALLEGQKRWDEAIAEQRERIQKTGGGRGKLWVLQGQVGDEAGQKTVIEELKKPELKAIETLRAVRILGEAKGSEAAKIAAVETSQRELLRSLLVAPRVLSDEEQMQTRILLARNLWKTGEIEAAMAAAKMEQPTVLRGNARNSWNELARLQTSLAQAFEKLPKPAQTAPATP